jgi:hypothetical protein
LGLDDTSRVGGGQVEDATLQIVDPSPDRLQLLMGNLLVELLDPFEESADRAGGDLTAILGVWAEQAMPIARQGQERRPERCVFGVENRFRDAPTPARDSRPDRVPPGLGYGSGLTQ